MIPINKENNNVLIKGNLSLEELMDLRGKFIDPNSISFEDFQRLLRLCDYSESEYEEAIDMRKNGKGQFVV